LTAPVDDARRRPPAGPIPPRVCRGTLADESLYSPSLYWRDDEALCWRDDEALYGRDDEALYGRDDEALYGSPSSPST
jgi:hypothetical protein